MGIEDLNLDLGELAERVLVVTHDHELAEVIKRLLLRRGYQYLRATNFAQAVKFAKDNLIDLVIHHLSADDVVGELLAKIRREPGLKIASIMLLHPADLVAQISVDLEREGYSSEATSLPLPLNPGDFLVKIATQLRKRKLKREDQQLETNIAVQNAQLRDLTTRFKRELKEAQSVQQSLLPQKLPQDSRISLAFRYLPLEAVGGDLYDLWQIDESRFGLFIGDVTGHGISAAFIGAMTKVALAYARKVSPANMLAEINQGIVDHMPEGRFVTAAAAIYDATTCELMVARAGNPPLLLHRKGSTNCEEINCSGLPLGVTKDAVYELYSTKLATSDRLLLFTDGLTETTDMNGRLLGVADVGRVFAADAALTSISQCLDRLLTFQHDFSGGRLIKDDTTLIGLECRC